MRNRVVHVQHVQLVALRHFRHPPGQRQAVRRVLKERIVRDLHLVIVDARGIRVQTDRIRISDEMDLVPARGQFHSQFGGDNPAAAVSWIASDADVHLASVAKPICPCRFLSGDATSPPPNHTRIRPPSTTTVGSQITLEFHACVPLYCTTSFVQLTPSVERARRRYRFPAKSRTVYSIQ